MLEVQLLTVRAITDTVERHGGVIPDDLRRALDAYAAALAFDDSPAVGHEDQAGTVDPGGVADLIRATADAELRRKATVTAKGLIVGRLGRRVLAAARAGAVDLTEALRPVWDEHAGRFAELVADLPGDVSPAALLGGSPEVLDRFQRATAAGAVLDELRGHRIAWLVPSGQVPGDRELVAGTDFAVVRNTGSARRVAQVTGSGQRGPLGPFGDLLGVAGVEGLAWRTAAEQADYIASLPEVETHHVAVGRGAWALVEA